MNRTFAAAARRSPVATLPVRRAVPTGFSGATAAPAARTCPDPRLDEALKLLLAVGAVLVLLLPGARGSLASVGWLPMWLLGMPLTALWAIRGFPLPWGRRALASIRAQPRRGRATPQARRRIRPPAAATRARAA